MTNDQLSYGDKIFKLLQNLKCNVNKPDLHSFKANVNEGVVFVDARQDEVYINEMKCDTTHIGWCGTYMAAANRLEILGLDLDSIEI